MWMGLCPQVLASAFHYCFAAFYIKVNKNEILDCTFIHANSPSIRHNIPFYDLCPTLDSGLRDLIQRFKFNQRNQTWWGDSFSGYKAGWCCLLSTLWTGPGFLLDWISHLHICVGIILLLISSLWEHNEFIVFYFFSFSSSSPPPPTFPISPPPHLFSPPLLLKLSLSFSTSWTTWWGVTHTRVSGFSKCSIDCWLIYRCLNDVTQLFYCYLESLVALVRTLGLHYRMQTCLKGLFLVI